MGPMQPGQAPAPQAPDAPQQGGGGKASKLVSETYSNLLEQMQMLDSVPSISPDQKQAFGQIVQDYQNFVQSLMSGGAVQPQEAPVKGNFPVETGGAETKPVL